jgi:hypothetical protein
MYGHWGKAPCVNSSVVWSARPSSTCSRCMSSNPLAGGGCAKEAGGRSCGKEDTSPTGSRNPVVRHIGSQWTYFKRWTWLLEWNTEAVCTGVLDWKSSAWLEGMPLRTIAHLLQMRASYSKQNDIGAWSLVARPPQWGLLSRRLELQVTRVGGAIPGVSAMSHPGQSGDKIPQCLVPNTRNQSVKILMHKCEMLEQVMRYI